MNVGLNWRVQQQGIAPESVDPRQLRRIGTQPEAPDGPRLPLELVLDELDFAMVMQAATVARRWKLRGRNDKRGESALRDLLIRRYHYATDDVPHRDLVDCLDDAGNLLPILDPAPED